MPNRVRIEIVGKNPNYFLKKVIEKKINIYSMSKDKNSLTLLVNVEDYYKIKKIKTSYQIHIIERYGISKALFLVKNSWYVFLFIILGFVLILIGSQFILDVEVVHPNQKLVEIVRNDLKELGLQKYHFKVSYLKKEKIKEKILEREKEYLEWMEIEEYGTKYKILLEERKKNISDNECIPRNIISKKNAIIMEIYASEGEVVKKKDDYVTKGETIISGFIHNKDLIVSKRCSIGTVYGEVWYRVKVLLPKEETKKVVLRKYYWGGSFSLFSKEFSFGKKNSTFDKTEYNIIEGSVIPFHLGIVKYQEVRWQREIYSSERIEEKAFQLAEEKIAGSFQVGEEVLMKKVLKKIEKDSKIEVEVFLKVKEDITDYFDISQIEIPKEE